MKNIIFAFFFLYGFSSLHAQFGPDIMVKQSAYESYTDPDAVATTDGKLFVTYLVDSAGTKGWETAMSDDSGLSWELVYRFFNPDVSVNKVVITSAFMVTEERVMVLMTSQENINFTSSLDIFYFSATTGYYQGSANIESGVTSRHAQVDIESNAKSGVASGVFAFIVSYSGDMADSIRYFCSNGPGFYSKHVASTGPGQLGTVHINHAINQNFPNGLFMMAWDDLYGNNRVSMASTGNNPMPAGAIITMRVDDDIVANTGRIRKPYVMTQNNNGPGPSGTSTYGLLHGFFYLRDSTDMSGADVLGDVNKNYITFTSFSEHCMPEPTNIMVGDYAAVNYKNEAHVVYYNAENHYLNWKSQMDFLNNPSNSFTEETIPSGRINDVPSITIAPDPVVILSTLYSKPAFFWVDHMNGKGSIKYDAPYMSNFASVDETPATECMQIYPNPVTYDQRIIHIRFETGVKYNGPVRIEVINMNGQVCQETVTTYPTDPNQPFSLPLNEQVIPGMYMLRLIAGDGCTVSKFIIK